jgi:hypothetical protein
MSKTVVLRKTKPILSLDFDGVCHSYTSGWQGADVISDPPVDGLFEFLNEAVEEFDIHIFSTRSQQEGGIDAMIDWLSEHDDDSGVIEFLSFPTEKPPAKVGLDDRVLTFTGDWPDIDDLVDFKPWNKEDV